MAETSAGAVLQDLLATVPREVVGAAEILSLPHSTDDSMAVDLVRRFSSANGTTIAAVAEVKRLPFIGPAGRGRWKIASPMREALEARLQENQELVVEIDAYLAERFATDAAALPSGAAAARELRWRSVYHRVSVSPTTAFAELDAFVERAASVGQLSDVQAAVELTERRSPLLADYQIEVAYVVGRSAYAFGDDEVAEDRFLRVWQSDTDPHRRIVSGHLLGVIWSRRNREPWWSRSEDVLTAAAELAAGTGERYGEAVILTTLGTLQLRLGGDERIGQAERALRRSLEIGSHLGAHQGLALSSLGAVLSRQGSRSQLLEAEGLLRQSLELLPRDAQGAAEDRLANVLGQLGTTSGLEEAEQLLTKRLAEETDLRDVAVSLNMLASTLVRRGDPELLPRAEAAIERSIELGKQSENPRHTAMALLTGSFVAEKAGDLPKAIARMEELISINQGLGLEHEVARSQKRVAALRARSPTKRQLGQG